MGFSRWKGLVILAVEILLIALFAPIAYAYPPRWVQGEYSPSYIEEVNVWQVTGNYACNTVQNRACHAYCTNRHGNAIYVSDRVRYISPCYVEVGWIWGHSEPYPVWYVDTLNNDYIERYYQFTEQITPGTNHILKCQWVVNSSDRQWRFYRDGGEICRLGGITVTWGFAQVSGEKWDYTETNWSDFWGCRHKGSPLYTNPDKWFDWDMNSAKSDNDPFYRYNVISPSSGNIRPG